MKIQPPCPELRRLGDVTYPQELSTWSDRGCPPWDIASKPTSLVFFYFTVLLPPSTYRLFLGALVEKSTNTQIFILGSTSGNFSPRLCSITITSSVQVTIISYTVPLQQASCYLFPRFVSQIFFHLRVTCVTLVHGHHPRVAFSPPFKKAHYVIGWEYHYYRPNLDSALVLLLIR